GMFINAGLSPVLKVSSGLNQVFLVLHGAFLMLDKHLVNQSWRVKLSYAAVSSQFVLRTLKAVDTQRFQKSLPKVLSHMLVQLWKSPISLI
ncbi:hypothetical protein, partial [Vibrio sp. SG41-7]|uniref:hypothetical protein n=1 Tax=Vibrio sp. SG41-7 TaxID=2760973 RepID=UPI0021761D06